MGALIYGYMLDACMHGEMMDAPWMDVCMHRWNKLIENQQQQKTGIRGLLPFLVLSNQ